MAKKPKKSCCPRARFTNNWPDTWDSNRSIRISATSTKSNVSKCWRSASNMKYAEATIGTKAAILMWKPDYQYSSAKIAGTCGLIIKKHINSDF